MAAAEPHPGPEILSDYALGRLVDGEFVAVAEHVDRCDECQETLSFLSLPDDTMVRSLRGDAPNDPFGEEPECAAAVAAIEHGFASHDEPCSTMGLNPAATRTDDDGPLATIRDYELLAPLGRGGMGVVYRARHMRLDRLVAVKVLPAERMRQPQAVARFHREMKALGNLDHPHIVRAYDAGEAEGKHFLAMELIDGVDLGTLAEREGPLAVADACELVRQAALGLDYAHRNGLVHRDVKPSNLMLDRTGAVKVLDLGLARLLEESEGETRAKPQAAEGSAFQVLSSELTGADQAMGTPDYMAPEQCTHCHAVDARTDVYSLGATLYRLLAGCAPYSGARYDTVAKKIAGLTSDPVPALTEHRRDLPSGLVALVHRMLAKDAEQRVATPGEVAMHLTPFCRGQRVVDLAGGRAKPQAAGGAGRRWAVAVAAAGAIAWLAPALARVMTPYGELVVEIAEEARDDVKIEVQRGSEVHILGEKPGARWSISLKDGTWQVKLDDSTNLYEIDADKVTMSRGERQVVRVTLRRKAKDDVPALSTDPRPTAQPREHLGETEETRLAILDSRDPRTGHLYRRGNMPMSWHEARAYCEEQGGHLATIESAEENEFLYQTFARDQACWLGATREERAPRWRWVTGEPMEFTNWFRDEPRTALGQPPEFYAAFGNRVSMRGGQINFHFDGYWASVSAAGQQNRLAFVLPLCEWEPDAAAGRLPTPVRPAQDAEHRFDLSSLAPLDASIPVEQVETPGGLAWRFDVGSSQTFRLIEHANPATGEAIITFRAEMRTEKLEGRAYLELQAAGPDSVVPSRGYHHAMTASTDWKLVETPLVTPASPPLDKLLLSLVVEGKGAVSLRNLEIVVHPLRAMNAEASSSNPTPMPASP